MSASIQRKVTNQEIEVIIYLIDKLNSFKITVVSLVFDGDTTYSKLVKNWNIIVSKRFHSKVISPIENDEIKKFSLETAIGPHHLLKRGMLMQNFKQDENYVNIQQWKEIFDIPSVVLFAVKLFNTRIISMLYEMDDRPTLSYFIPPSMLELALKHKTISKVDRQNLLEICLYHLFLYNDTLKNCKKKKS